MNSAAKSINTPSIQCGTGDVASRNAHEATIPLRIAGHQMCRQWYAIQLPLTPMIAVAMSLLPTGHSIVV